MSISDLLESEIFLPFLILIVCFCMSIPILIKGVVVAKVNGRNAKCQPNTARVRIISKRKVMGLNAVVVEFETGVRQELDIDEYSAPYLVENDIVTITYQGSRITKIHNFENQNPQANASN